MQRVVGGAEGGEECVEDGGGCRGWWGVCRGWGRV